MCPTRSGERAVSDGAERGGEKQSDARQRQELVLRTYDAVFDRVSVWYGMGVDLLILGQRAGASSIDIDRLGERAASPDFVAALERCGIRSLPGLLAHELLPVGVLSELGLQEVLHTLYHPRLGHRAARAFFAGTAGHLPPSARDRAAEVGAQNSWGR